MSVFASLRKKYVHTIATVTALLVVPFVRDAVLVEVWVVSAVVVTALLVVLVEVLLVSPTQNK